MNIADCKNKLYTLTNISHGFKEFEHGDIVVIIEYVEYSKEVYNLTQNHFFDCHYKYLTEL